MYYHDSQFSKMCLPWLLVVLWLWQRRKDNCNHARFMVKYTFTRGPFIENVNTFIYLHSKLSPKCLHGASFLSDVILHLCQKMTLRVRRVLESYFHDSFTNILYDEVSANEFLGSSWLHAQDIEPDWHNSMGGGFNIELFEVAVLWSTTVHL